MPTSDAYIKSTILSVVTFLLAYLATLSYPQGTLAAVILAVVMFILHLIITVLEPPSTPLAPSPSPTPTPSPSPIFYMLDGQQIQVTPNLPIGNADGFYPALLNLKVGDFLNAQFTTPNATVVPAGAVYIGKGEFEKNGSFYN